MIWRVLYSFLVIFVINLLFWLLISVLFILKYVNNLNSVLDIVNVFLFLIGIVNKYFENKFIVVKM